GRDFWQWQIMAAMLVFKPRTAGAGRIALRPRQWPWPKAIARQWRDIPHRAREHDGGAATGLCRAFRRHQGGEVLRLAHPVHGTGIVFGLQDMPDQAKQNVFHGCFELLRHDDSIAMWVCRICCEAGFPVQHGLSVQAIAAWLPRMTAGGGSGSSVNYLHAGCQVPV